jgi:hypothetical protein
MLGGRVLINGANAGSADFDKNKNRCRFSKRIKTFCGTGAQGVTQKVGLN